MGTLGRGLDIIPDELRAYVQGILEESREAKYPLLKNDKRMISYRALVEQITKRINERNKEEERENEKWREEQIIKKNEEIEKGKDNQSFTRYIEKLKQRR